MTTEKSQTIAPLLPIAYCLIIVISVLGILATADMLLRWDILSENIEKLAYLIM